MTLVRRELNAKFDKENDGKILLKFVVETSNECGEKYIHWCTANDQLISGTPKAYMLIFNKSKKSTI